MSEKLKVDFNKIYPKKDRLTAEDVNRMYNTIMDTNSQLIFDTTQQMFVGEALDIADNMIDEIANVPFGPREGFGNGWEIKN